MRYRNDDIPEVFYQAIVELDKYYKGNRANFDYSITQLIDNPKRYWLRQRHDDEIIVDASTQLWRLFGVSLHSVLEKVKIKGHIAERRIGANIRGKRIEGGIDRYIESESATNQILDMFKEKIISSTTHNKIYTIQDYKLTSVWDYIYQSSYGKYENQVNGYGFLSRYNGFPVNILEVTPFYRDWHGSQLKIKKVYPPKIIQTLNFPLWTMERAEEYLSKRIDLLDKYSSFTDDGIPECTMLERFQDPDKWAIYRGKRRGRASKVCDTKEEAIGWIDGHKDNKYEIVFRPSIPKMCIDYCIVNNFCHWYKQWNNK